MSYYDYDDYVADNYDAIMAEDCWRQDLIDELEWFKTQLKIETDKVKLAKHHEGIRRIKKMLA
jgi:hypothetical protein